MARTTISWRPWPESESVCKGTDAQTNALTAAVKAENDVLVQSRKSALSDVIEKADKQRDGYFSGYREGVRSYADSRAGLKSWRPTSCGST